MPFPQNLAEDFVVVLNMRGTQKTLKSKGGEQECSPYTGKTEVKTDVTSYVKPTSTAVEESVRTQERLRSKLRCHTGVWLLELEGDETGFVCSSIG